MCDIGRVLATRGYHLGLASSRALVAEVFAAETDLPRLLVTSAGADIDALNDLVYNTVHAL